MCESVVVLDGTKYNDAQTIEPRIEPRNDRWRCTLCLWGSGLEDEEGEGS